MLFILFSGKECVPWENVTSGLYSKLLGRRDFSVECCSTGHKGRRKSEPQAKEPTGQGVRKTGPPMLEMLQGLSEDFAKKTPLNSKVRS